MKSLSEKAMLVRMKLGRYQPYAYDPTVTHQVERDNGVVQAGRFNKRLLKESKHLLAANQAYTAIYINHCKLTLPWLDEGVRILPAHMYFEYTQEMRVLVAHAEREVNNLATFWGDEVERDRQRLGAMFCKDDYPSSIRDRFYAKIQYLPVPAAGDFRVEITEDDKRSLEQAVREAEDQVKSYVLKSLLEPLQKAAEKLSTTIGADGSVFRDSLIENVLETAERMEKLNITDEPEIGRLIEAVKDMAANHHIRLPHLRKEQRYRDTAAAEVNAILSNLQGVIGD